MKNLYRILDLSEKQLFLSSIVCILYFYFNNVLVTSLLILLLCIYYKKPHFLILLLLLVKVNNHQIKIIEIKNNYSIGVYDNQKYMIKKRYNFEDKITGTFKFYRIQENDYFKINNIVEEIKIKNEKITPAIHIKPLLYSYIDKSFNDNHKQFLFSIFFNMHPKNSIAFQLQFHFLFIMKYLKKKNKKISNIFGLLSLLYQFNSFVLFELLENLKDDTSLKNFSSTIIVSILFFKHQLGINFLLFVVLKIATIFYQKYKLTKPIILLFSMIFFNSISIINFLFYKFFKWIAIINAIICTLLLMLPKILSIYLDIAITIFEKIPQYAYYQKLEILTILICVICMFKNKILFYIILLLPNHFRFHQEVIVDADTIIVKENFLKKPIIYCDKVNEITLKKYGINYYDKHSMPNYLFYLNDYYFKGINLDNYRNLPLTFYIGNEIDVNVLKFNKPEYIVIQSDNHENILIALNRQYYKSKKFRVIYILGYRHIIFD